MLKKNGETPVGGHQARIASIILHWEREIYNLSPQLSCHVAIKLLNYHPSPGGAAATLFAAGWGVGACLRGGEIRRQGECFRGSRRKWGDLLFCSWPQRILTCLLFHSVDIDSLRCVFVFLLNCVYLFLFRVAWISVVLEEYSVSIKNLSIPLPNSKR